MINKMMIGWVSKENFMRSWAWVQKGGWAVLDQGIFAGSNFAINILLARWLDGKAYGSFSLAYSIFLLISSFHMAVVTDPLMIFGAGKYRFEQKHYWPLVIVIHFAVMGMLSICMLICGYVFFSMNQLIFRIILALALSNPAILLLLVIRRIFFTLLRPELAALSGAIYTLIVLLFFYFLKSIERITFANVFYLMGISSVICSLVFLNKTGLKIKCFDSKLMNKLEYNSRDAVNELLGYLNMARDHWNYGKWAFGTSILIWLSGTQIYTVVAPVNIGLEAVAGLRALLNLVFPILQGMTAISSLSIPILSDAYKRNRLVFVRLIIVFASIFSIISILNFIILFFWGDYLLTFLYNNKYMDYKYLLPLIGFIPLVSSIGLLLSNALKSIEKPNLVLFGYFGAVIFTFVIGIPLGLSFGLVGLLVGLISTHLILGIIFLSLLYHQVTISK